jgi:hypothetical protein
MFLLEQLTRKLLSKLKVSYILEQNNKTKKDLLWTKTFFLIYTFLTLSLFCFLRAYI